MASFVTYFIAIASLVANTTRSLSGVASWTYYTSYAACCPDNPNYDASADTTECTEYSACDYSGDFAAIGHKSYEYVQNNNLVAFYDSSDPNGVYFETNYGNKSITLTVNDKTIEAIIADTCLDSDCDGCCTQNANPSGYLVDMEYWTVYNNFGDNPDSVVDGQIKFTIADVDAMTDDGEDGNEVDVSIYVAASLVTIVLCSAVIGLFFFRSRRKRRSMNHAQFSNSLMADEANHEDGL